MSYLKLSTMQYPLYEGDIRLEHPEISEEETGGTFPIPADYVFVEETPPPQINVNTQFLYEDTPQCINGVWKRVWIVADYTPEQAAHRAALIDKVNRARGISPQPTHPSNGNSGSAPNVI